MFKLLGIEPEEESLVSLLLAQSIFLGIFFGAFDISAHSLFLSAFDEKAMARAYVISGLSGIVLTTIYTWLQARLKFKFFAAANLIFITIVTLLLWISVISSPGKFVTFAVFVMLGPLNILAMLGFWGTTGRLFTLRQGKRLFGLVDAGLVLGIILSCYTIPVLLSLGFEPHNILLVSTASVLVAVIIQANIGRRFPFIQQALEKSEKKRGLSIFREDAYIRMMGIFIALSVMTAFFIQYSFMAVTRLQYPMEEDMARFLGLFTGSMMIFTLLIKLLLFSYLIRNYGLKTCLAISPVLVAGFTALAILIGLTMGFTPAAASGFLIFFLILAISRLFSKALKDSIESPSFKVMYQTVDEKIRYEVQSGIDGTINEISALSSGLLLAGLGALAFIKLIHFSWVLFLIIGLWIIVAFRLYREYRRSIRKSLEDVGTGTSESSYTENWEKLESRLSGNTLFRANYFRILTGDLSPIDKISNYWFFNNIVRHAKEQKDICMQGALKKITERNDIDETLRYSAVEVFEQLEKIQSNLRYSARGEGSQTEDEKIINTRKILCEDRIPQTTEILRLLRDNNPEARRAAIYMIGKFRLTDMIPEVCNCIGIHGLENDALQVLGSFGTRAYPDLMRIFLGSSGNIHTSKSIMKLLGTKCGEGSTEFLFARLWSNSRRLKVTAAEQLISCGFRAGEEERDKLHQLVSEIIGMITWNISAQASLVKTGNILLLEVIRNETSAWNDFLFMLLSIAYDKSSVEKIKINVESGTVESVNYALEMIDIVIDDAIKPKLIQLLDDVPYEEKLKNLQNFYPGEIQKFDSLIEDIINRDYNFLSIWTKACALRELGKLTNENLKESVLALLFSPEQILNEEAARVISETNKAVFDDVLPRIREKKALYLEKIISGDYPVENLLYEKVRFLKSAFASVPEDELLYLAESMQFITDPDSPEVAQGNNFILWPVIEAAPDTGLKVVFDADNNGKEIISGKNTPSKYYLLPLKTIEEFRILYPEHSFEIFHQIDKYLNNTAIPA